MNIFIGVVVGLLVLMILVVAHEFGHFVAARRNGVRVLEFGIGFPPRAIAWVKDVKTGKWRRLPRSEWKKAQITKTVGVDRGGEVARDDKPTKAVRTGRNTSLRVKSRPKLIERGLVFSLNWLPIGGFCQMDGESAEDEREGTFGHAKFWAKTKILFAGVAMNWLVAFIILTVLAWTGMPQFLENQFTVGSDTRSDAKPVMVASVAEGSPAARAGLEVGDYIVQVENKWLPTSEEIVEYNKKNADKEATYLVERKSNQCQSEAVNGDNVSNNVQVANNSTSEVGTEQTNCENGLEQVRITATLNPADAEYLLGVTMESVQTLSYSTWSAPIVGAGLTLQLTGETFAGLGQLVWNLVRGVGSLFSFDAGVRESGQQAISQVGDSVSGPVGIVGVLFPTFTAAGPTNLAFLAAVISVSLACMNVLPIPALDGGRWLLIAIFKLRHKRLTKAVEEKIVARAFLVLLALIIIVTILDITRFFR